MFCTMQSYTFEIKTYKILINDICTYGVSKSHAVYFKKIDKFRTYMKKLFSNAKPHFLKDGVLILLLVHPKTISSFTYTFSYTALVLVSKNLYIFYSSHS